MPVLAKETVEATTGVEHGQVVMATARVPGTHPVSDTIGGQRVSIPMKHPPGRSASQMVQVPDAILTRGGRAGPQTTIAPFTWSNRTPSAAEYARDTIGRTWRRFGKPKGLACFSMGRMYPLACLFKASSNALAAQSQMIND
jgi:hypothetical protein